MRILGLLFILVGLWLCFTILFAGPGGACIALGALLYYCDRGVTHGHVTTALQDVLGLLIGATVVIGVVSFIGLACGVKPDRPPRPSIVQPVRHPAPAPRKPHASRASQAR